MPGTAIPYELWDSLLRPLEAIFGTGNAVIAGGAVRDALIARPSKDIDIFVPVPDFEHLEFRLRMGLPKADFTEVRSWDPAYAHWFKGSDTTLLGVTTWKVRGVDAPVQIMGVVPTPDPDTSFADWVVSRADFGLCRAGYSIGNLITPNDFCSDLHQRRLTLLRADNVEQHAASMRRLRRLAKKLPDYTFVDGRPPEQREILSTNEGLA